jgi:hypothetical protein
MGTRDAAEAALKSATTKPLEQPAPKPPAIPGAAELVALRARPGREASSSAAVLDSQSVKTTESGGPLVWNVPGLSFTTAGPLW